MIFVVKRRHDCRDHFTLKAGKSPRLRSKLHDALNSDLDAFFLLWIGKMLDSVDNLLDDCSSSSVDTLLRARAREGCKKCLLTPDGFLSRALFADVVAHRSEQRVRFVVTTTKTEQEGTENTVSDQFSHCVNYVCRANLSVRGDLVSERSLAHD